MRANRWIFFALLAVVGFAESIGFVPTAFAIACSVVAGHTPSEAESAFLHADYDKAATLYRAQLQQRPNDPIATAGLGRVLLKQQKVAEAADTAKKAIAANPPSAVLLTVQGEVEYRQGTPWLAMTTAGDAAKIDPCLPRLHLLLAKLYRLNSMYASEAMEVGEAHSLDPNDFNIRSRWIATLPLAQRITELEKYLASPSGDDAEEIHQNKLYLESLKKYAAEPHKACHLVSSSTSTEIAFAPIMHDANHIRAFGLDVKLNGKGSKLQIDTGAGGFVVSRPVAEHAGLTPFSATEMSGIGSEGSKNGYTAYADSIQIGSLEFHDCVVEVLDARTVSDSDGLIEMDVFSRFLVTLDYPMRKLALSPLPTRPDDTAAHTLSLQAENDAEGEGTGNSKEAKTNAAPLSSSAASSSTTTRASSGLHDRYIAPEMKGYSAAYRIGHHLLIPTVVNQASRRLFILDSGAWTTTISTQSALELAKLHEEDAFRVHGISGKVDQAYTVDDITLDFAGIRQPSKEMVSFDMSLLSKHTGMEISGFIGATTLRQVTTHIDYRDGLVKFDYDPNRGYRMNPGQQAW